MNKEYTYIDGKAIIKDEKGNQKPIEYYDNLDDVLVQENLVESIEDKILHLEKEGKKYSQINKEKYIPIVLIVSVLLSIIGVPPIFYFSLDINIKAAILLSSIFSAFYLPLAGIYEYILYSNHKYYLKKEKGINNELEFLKQQLPKEKEKLMELQNKKSKVDENKEFRVVKVDDKKILKELRDCLNLYYDLGYDGEKYYKYYKQGKLDKKMGKSYNNVGVEIAKNYLEEKGPMLVKKKNKSK